MKVERAKALLGLTSALLLLSAQAATYVHLATVRHVACPEHGELVEAGASTAHAHPLGLSESGQDEGALAHQHDHCIFGLHARTGATFAPSANAIETAAPVGLLTELASVHAPPAPDLLAAPKQSPPQV